MTSYKDFMHKYVSFTPAQWEKFETKVTTKIYQKGDIILAAGDVCKELLFIEGGLARGYIIAEDGKDYTWSIYFNDKDAQITNFYIVDYESFLAKKPAQLSIDALEDTRVATLTYDNLQYLYDNVIGGDRFGRLMAEGAYTTVHNRVINRISKSAKERFDEFVAQTPYLLDKVPQYHIATSLGITPQHLSRLKQDYQENK